MYTYAAWGPQPTEHFPNAGPRPQEATVASENQKLMWATAATGFFKANPAQIYNRPELAGLLESHRSEWQAPPSLTFKRFLGTMESQGSLKRLEIRRLPSKGRIRRMGIPYDPRYVNPAFGMLTRYVSREPSIYGVALSLRPDAYLSHATALHLHGLTTQSLGPVYVNKEQTPKPSRANLDQGAMSAAFKRAPRVSQNTYSYEGVEIVLLSGKHTNRLQVGEIADGTGGTVPATQMERTLIDVAVRPVYAGGASRVLEAFRAAKGRLSVTTLLEALQGIRHVYPYHQAIGFYMERAGYTSDDCEQLRALGLNFDFYLEHGMVSPEYDVSWRLHYPEGF